MHTFTLTQISVLNAQVCGTGSYDQALKWLNKVHPSGTQNGWSKSKELAPVKCADNSNKKHYIFEC